MGMMIHRRKEAHWYPKEEEQFIEPVIEDSVEPDKEEKKEVVYTLEEINSLPFFSLKSVASNMGIDVKGKKGFELKAELIKKLGL